MRAISVDIHGMIIWNFGGTSKRGKDAYLKNLSHISNHKAKRNGEERLPLLVVDEEKKRDDVCTYTLHHDVMLVMTNLSLLW